ncbi:MAG: DNA mismatch repair endonuclease MutL [Treponema sp.]|jgi:DNA mismatch repair protein MutL|nr:DNA mismatch repair endonuclease MutL [Treponema sp.]
MFSSRIQVLPPEEARKIAAGEVIDRPAALVREFIDNALDSGASLVEVSIEGGGSRKVEVADDGAGMGREDLELCWLAHATSKIRSLEDLNTAETVGFRGEALAAAAAVSELEITSSVDGREAWRLEVGPGEANPPRLTQTRRTRGASVRAFNLFDTIPARKRFLKRDGSEGGLCRQAFLEKALAFPETGFRFSQDGKMKDFLPAVKTKKERFAAILPDGGAFLHEIHVNGDGFGVDLVIGGPELFRNDRRLLYVFANGRRIQDYGLMLAIEYGVQGLFPNGTHPLGAAFVEINPGLADFNIHPAKREVRFSDAGAIHHAISSALRDFSRRLGLSRGLPAGDIKGGSAGQPGGPGGRAAGGEAGFAFWDRGEIPGGQARRPAGGVSAGHSLALEALLEKAPAFASLPGRRPDAGGAAAGEAVKAGGMAGAGAAAEEAPVYGEPRYAGRAFGLFILVEWGEKLFIVDQHAAHERILYDRFLSAPIPGQELIVPIPFSTESDEEDRFLEAKKEELSLLAINIERDGSGWRVDSLPADWRLSDAETVREILELRKAGENMAERWAATLCCHQAVRDGDYLDDESAFALARQAFELPDPRCPHGRPVWTEISREALYRAVRRI